jgi:hypothetical protein
MTPSESFNAFSGLDLLSSAVVLVDAGLILRHLNPPPKTCSPSARGNGSAIRC